MNIDNMNTDRINAVTHAVIFNDRSLCQTDEERWLFDYMTSLRNENGYGWETTNDTNVFDQETVD